jgi:hypothetical protein
MRGDEIRGSRIGPAGRLPVRDGLGPRLVQVAQPGPEAVLVLVIPILDGIAYCVLPPMIGAPDMALAQLNGLSYSLLPIGD